MKTVFLILMAICVHLSILGQAPLQFKYQAALRNADGTVMANQEKTVVVKLLLVDS